MTALVANLTTTAPTSGIATNFSTAYGNTGVFLGLPDNFYNIRRILFMLAMVVFVTLGCLGGSMTFILINYTPALKNMTSNVFLKLQAVASMGFLLIQLLSVCEILTGLVILRYSTASCQFFGYIVFNCDSIAMWAIVAISFERYISLIYPWKNVRDGRRKVYLIACGIVCLSLVHGAGLNSLIINGNGEGCQTDPAYWREHIILSLLDYCLSCYLPCVLCLAFNLATIYKSQRFLTLATKQTSAGPLGNMSYRSTSLYSWESLATETSVTGGSSGLRRLKSQQRSMTTSLLLVSASFCLLNLPVYIVRLLATLDLDDSLSLNGTYWFGICETLSYFAYYSHHAFAFYIYAFSTAHMRKYLKPAALVALRCACCTPGNDTQRALQWNNNGKAVKNVEDKVLQET